MGNYYSEEYTMKGDVTLGTVVALGNFDGLHIGHMTVIRAALKMAERLSAKPYALVFKEHPLSVLTGVSPQVLFTDDIKARTFKETGITLCKLDFASLKDMSPEEFFETILIKRMGAVGICCGFNYSFGKEGRGTPELLKKLCIEKGIEFYVSPELDFEGEPVSSTRIRNAIESGQIELANVMLGRPFTYRQIVVDGDKRGRAMGTPTINQFLSPELVEPKHGVYMSKVDVLGRKFYAVTNIGVRPTIGHGPTGSETHILDFNGDLYGKYVDVSLLHYIRSEIKFDSLSALEEQIREDALKVREIAKKIRYKTT